MSKGFVVIAQKNDNADYLRMAYALALNLKITQKHVSDLSVIIDPGTKIPDKYSKVFDQVIELPQDDAKDLDWKISNKWQVFELSPYDETLFLDADMYFSYDIGWAWDLWEPVRGFHIATCAKTYRGDNVDNDRYRKHFVDNDLPNVYSTMVYFDKGDQSKEIFTKVKEVYDHWNDLKELYPNLPENYSGDLVFAVALDMLGLAQEKFMMPNFVHMKTKAQHRYECDGMREDWTFHFEPVIDGEFRLNVGNYMQIFPFHYANPEFLTDDLICRMEGKVAE